MASRRCVTHVARVHFCNNGGEKINAGDYETRIGNGSSRLPVSGSFSSSSPDEAGTRRLAGIMGLAVGEVSRLFALGLDSTLSVSLLI